MKATLGLLADYANTTPEGKLNIMGIFQRIFVQGFPVVHSSCYLIVTLEADRTEAGQQRNLEIQLMDTDGQKMFSLGGPVQVPEPVEPGPITINQIIGLSGIPFQKEGDYSFQVLVNSDHKLGIPFKVVKQAPPPAK